MCLAYQNNTLYHCFVAKSNDGNNMYRNIKLQNNVCKVNVYELNVFELKVFLRNVTYLLITFRIALWPFG